MTQDTPITRLLMDWQAGDSQALHRLMPLVHDNLHQLAGRYMRNEKVGHTLQATALVNEAFLKLVDNSASWQSRAHFIAIAARAMRQILVDHARARRRQKRGGVDVQVTLHDAMLADNRSQPDILDIEQALTSLGELDERKARIIELSFFGGLSYEEIAEVIGISPATVDRDLRFSRAWLQRALSGDD